MIKLRHVILAVLVLGVSGCSHYWRATDVNGKVWYVEGSYKGSKDLVTGEWIHFGNTTTFQEIPKSEAVAAASKLKAAK